MNTFVVEIWDDEGRATTFYTVRKDGSAETETDKFFLKYERDTRYQEQIKELVSFILEAMGDHLGAREEFFRFENAASALPPSPRAVRKMNFNFEGCPLRLYCMRLTERIVILMNGGIKESRSAQESKDVSMKMLEATQFAKAIDKALVNKEIWIGPFGRTLESDDDELILSLR